MVQGKAPEIACEPLCLIRPEDGGSMAASVGTGQVYDAEARLMGIIPIRKVLVNVVPETEVVLCGTPFGIRLLSKGVLVIGSASVYTAGGEENPGEDAGITAGDIIIKIDQNDITDIAQFVKSVAASEGKPMSVILERDGKSREAILTPAFSEPDGCYKAGLWVRDSAAGIGMLTFIDPATGGFGGLGHAICDADTGVTLPVASGSICDAVLTGIKKGAAGTPGELIGFLGEKNLGGLSKNDVSGIYGNYTAPVGESKRYKIAMKQEAEEGKAQLLTTLPEGTPELYDVVIEKINFDEHAPSRNMVIKVADQRLLDTTGGIVQGMSGSPIIQNGRFVAAATHVFINDPTRGYAIFAENMVKTSRSDSTASISSATQLIAS